MERGGVPKVCDVVERPLRSVRLLRNPAQEADDSAD